jgi:hypothetical protein
MMSTDPRIVYGPDRIRTRFDVVDAEHPGGHHGQDFSLPAGGGSEVVAYTECTVVECGIEVTKGFTAVLGWYVVARTPLGRYLGWAHLRRGTRAKLGKVLKPGDLVGLAASGPRPSKYQSPEVAADDYPGTAWAGAHIHTTNGSTITSIFSGVGLIDPLPGIRAALTSLASGGTYTPITQEEEDMALTQEDVNLITQGLRNAVWLLGPNGEPLRVEAGLKDIANRQAQIIALENGFGRRIENTEKWVSDLTALISADNDDATLSDEQITRIATAIASAGVIAKFDDSALATFAKAVNDENDARERARLAV